MLAALCHALDRWTFGYCTRLPHYRHATDVLRVISKNMLSFCAVYWLSKTRYYHIVYTMKFDA